MSDNEVLNPLRHDGEERQVARPMAAAMDVEVQRAIAEVQAAIMLARANPRDPVKAVDQVLQDCTRITLAEKATYDYVKGGSSITGPTIRLAEAIARRWGNIECGVKELARHDGISECMSYAWDLQTGYREIKTFVVEMRRTVKDGKGGHISKPITDEREIYETIANYGARRKRACIQAVIDTDVFDAAVEQCEKTMKTKMAVTPEMIAAVLQQFEGLGVTREMLEKRVQRRFDERVPPALMLQLKKIYNSITDQMSVASDWFDDPGVIEGAATGVKTARGRSKPQAKKKADDKKDPGEPVDAKTVTNTSDEPLTGPEVEQLSNRLTAATITGQEFCKAFKIDSLLKLKRVLLPEAIRWISDPMSAPNLGSADAADA